ncbi:DUF3558 family protein [Embleya sp. NPDC005971]|uniref:DUF3558 family protein n=1 Tax=unclassified Embleya TaxID=2699296 RepID=UPI00340CCA1D
MTAVLVALAVGGAAAGCGNDDRSPLDTVRALESGRKAPTGEPTGTPPPKPPRRSTAPPTDTPSSTTAPPSASSSASSTGTSAPATGPIGPYLEDPCRFLTPAQVATALGLPVVEAEVTKRSSSSFCHYRDSRGLSMMTVMTSTSNPRYSTAEQAAKGTISASDNPVILPAVGDAAFTYRGSISNGVVWSKQLGDTYLDVDVYVSRTDKDVPPDVLAGIARTMVGRL